MPAALRESAAGRPRFSRACLGLDSFFEHCGLEPEVIKNLAREKFTANTAFESLALKFCSMSCPDSESEPSQHSSSDSGNEPLRGKNKPLPSQVIEHNSRVIQWLYGCKRTKEPKGKALSVLV